MNLSPLPIQKFFGNNGRPLVGGLLFTYVAGTSTKIATYTDESGGPTNTNPIVLDFRGEARIWLDPGLTYKFVLAPPGDTDPPTKPIWTVDNITTGGAAAFSNFAIDTGTPNNIIVAAARADAYFDGLRVSILVANTNTGPTTINYNALGPINVELQNGTSLVGGELQANGVYEFIYAAGAFQLLGPTLNPTQQVQVFETAAGLTPANYWILPRQPGRFATATALSDAADLYATFGVPRKKPTGFSYVPGNIWSCEGAGLAVHDFDAEQNFLAIYGQETGATASGQYWVDPINGSDANNGAFNAPYKTIRACVIGASALSIIWLLPGVYTDTVSRFDVRGADNTVAGGTSARAIRIMAWAGLGSVIFRCTGDQPGAMAWALTPATSFEYEATPSGGETAVHIIFHDDGGEIQIQWYSSAANVNANVAGWYQDPATKKIYIRFQNRDISLPGNAARFEIMYTGNNPICLGGKIFVKDVIFRGSPEFEVSIQVSGSTFRGVMYARNCWFQYLQYHNLASLGATTFMQECVSERSLGGDGFNYTDAAQSCEAIEVDCIGRNNGVVQYKDFDGDRNKQGSSIHNSAVIMRVNGEYYGNYGQNIADTGVTSKCWLVGCVLGAPAADLASNVGIGGYYNLWTEGDAWLDNVNAGTKAATYGLWIESGTASLYNCDFYGTTAVIGKNAGATALYDPVS